MLKWLLTFVLDYFLGKLGEFVAKFRARKKRQEEIQKDAEKSVEKLEKAETGEEIDAGTDEALDKF